MEVRSCFPEIFLKLVGSIVNNTENKYKKKEHKQHSLLFKVLRSLSYYSNVTDPSIIPWIFIFLSCLGKAHDNKEFNRENSKPRRES